LLAAACAFICACGHGGFERVPDASGVTGDGAIDGDALDASDADVNACLTSANLLAYWPFDEGAGTVLGDLSPNQVFADVSGTTSWVTGAIGGALKFTRQGSGVAKLRSVSPFNFGNESFTLSYWLNLASTPTSPAPRPFELAYCGTAFSYIYTRVQTDGNAGLGVYDANDGYGQTTTPAAAVGISKWTHVAHVIDRVSQLGITYVNGSLAGSNPIPMVTDVIDCSQAMDLATIGGWATTGPGAVNYYFDGGIDDLRIYGRILSDAEVATLAGLNTTGCPF
jgi:hypothetical protein